MPGLIGHASATDAPAGPAYEAMAAPMRRGRPSFREESLAAEVSRWALGRIHLGALNPAPQLRAGDTVQALFHGDLHNARALWRLAGRDDDADDTAALLRALHRRFGPDLGPRLEGAFGAAVLDAESQVLALFSDPLGSSPLYWHAGPRGFSFASELKAVVRAPGVRPRLEPGAVADYLTFGFPMGEKTLAEDVSLLPPGSTLVYDLARRTVDIRRRTRISDFFSLRAPGRARYIEEVTDGLVASVSRAAPAGDPVDLSLSGGLDSRLILAALGHLGRPVSSYTLGVRGCADQVIAERLARLGGASHRSFELDQSYLGEFLPRLARMVSLTEGMYLSHGLTEMLALEFLERDAPSILLRGHGGELAKASLAWPFHTDGRIRAMASTAEFVPYLLQRVNYVAPGLEVHDLFLPAWAERIAGAARRSLEESVRGLDLAPVDLCSYLYLAEHHRRSTIASLELFRNAVEVRLPLADAGFLTALLGGPAGWRDDTTLHKAMIARLAPRLLAARNSNTGAPAGAGPLRESVMDKVNTLLRRLDVHGWRHYHNFDAWMRQRLQESVQTVVLAPSALERGIFRPETLRRLFEENACGRANHGYLFQVLLILELWQRETGV